MESTEDVYDRFDAFTAVVARRLQNLGHDPSVVLIACRTRLMLAAMTLPTGDPVAFVASMRASLQAPAPVEDLADHFIANWLTQIRIDQCRCA